MLLLAKRVRASRCAPKITSTSGTPRDFADACTFSKSSSHRSMVRMGACSSGIGGSDLDVAESRGAGAVAGADHLLGLALAAVGYAPEDPVIAVGDGLAGVPELGGDAAVSGILEHAAAPTILDLPGDLAARS